MTFGRENELLDLQNIIDKVLQGGNVQGMKLGEAKE